MDENKEAFELVESAAGYAGNLYNGFQKIVADLRGDNTEAGLSALAPATEGLEWLMGAVSALNVQGEGFEGFETEDINGFLAELSDAVGNRDYAFAADLIDFEILAVIDEWGNKLDGIMGI